MVNNSTGCLLFGNIWKKWNFQGISFLSLKIGNFHGILFEENFWNFTFKFKFFFLKTLFL